MGRKVDHAARPTSLISTPSLRGEALYGVAGDIVRAVEPETEADPAALLIHLLVAFGFVVGRCAFFLADGSRHFPNLYAVVVGETSKSRKGTSWSRIRAIFESLPKWPRDRVMSGLSSGEGLIERVSDSAEDKRLLVTQTEFGSVLRVMERPGNTLSPVMRDAWDGNDLRVMTKNSPAEASGEHISIIGHITKDEILQHIETTELWDGFANRFLWCFARRARLLPHGGTVADSVMRPLVKRLSDAAMWAGRLREQRISWNKKPAKSWEQIYARLAQATPGLVGAVTSRAEAQVVRLAVIYALLDKSVRIRVEHLKAALAVWEYCEASARLVFGDSLGDPTADAILALLRTNSSGVSRTQMNQQFQHHTRRAEFNRALALLESRQLARKSLSPTRGRPVEQWFAVTSK